MTETPDTPEPTTGPAEDATAESTSGATRRARFGGVARTNRITILIVGAAAVAFTAALLFGVGIIVGANLTDSEGGHHRSGESSEYRGEGDHRDEHHRGDGGGGEERDSGDAPQEGADGERRDEGRPDQAPAPVRPTASAPPTSPNAPPAPRP